jgi:hypothetical protein
MLIVLEGVDGAGKTTLTDRLLSSLPNETKRLHSGPLKGDALKEYVWRLRDYRPDSTQNLICDRWHVGELVYGPLYRGSSKLTKAMQTYVEMYLDKLGAYKLVVTADLSTISQRLGVRGEDFLRAEHLGLVWDFYNEYAHQHGWQLVGSDEVMGSITGKARRLRQEARRVDKFRSYVGSPHPRHLFLAAGSSAPLPGRPSYEQAFVPYPDTPYAKLIDHLTSIGVRDFAFADPLVDDPMELWQTLGRPSTTAVDNETSRLIRHVPHTTLNGARA